ncbi:MAG: 16S rRNA processing protein RimM [Cytophagales bacterium]|nr:MAG: 16S rRNA processing protein RimM [Cytophagales bacterium]
MQKEDCFELGHISRSVGLKGDLVIFLDVDDPTYYKKLQTILVENQPNVLIPYTVERIKIQGEYAHVHLQDIASQEQARALASKKIYLPLHMLPDIGEDNFYHHQVIGYTVFDEEKGALGTVKAIYETGFQDILAMEYQSKEILIPLIAQVFKKVNHNEKKLFVNLPEGLIEVYLEEEQEKEPKNKKV